MIQSKFDDTLKFLRFISNESSNFNNTIASTSIQTEFLVLKEFSEKDWYSLLSNQDNFKDLVQVLLDLVLLDTKMTDEKIDIPNLAFECFSLISSYWWLQNKNLLKEFANTLIEKIKAHSLLHLQKDQSHENHLDKLQNLFSLLEKLYSILIISINENQEKIFLIKNLGLLIKSFNHLFDALNFVNLNDLQSGFLTLCKKLAFFFFFFIFFFEKIWRRPANFIP